MTAKYSVQLCQFPGGNSTHPDVGDWLCDTTIKMKADDRIDRIGRFKMADTPITAVRNQAIWEAMEGGYDYTLMIDSDMSPDYLVGQDPAARPFWDVAWGFMMNRRALDRLGEKIIGDGSIVLPPSTIAAPYCGPPPMELPYIFRWKSNESNHPNPDFYLQMIEREDAAMRSGIEEVAALPTGLILYDNRIFRRLPPPWFDYEYDHCEDKPKWYEGEWPEAGLNFMWEKISTEDVYQTRNASMMGYPSYVAWDCWAVHNKGKRVEKPRILTRESVRDNMRDAISSKYATHREKLRFVNQFDPASPQPEPEPPAPVVADTKPRHECPRCKKLQISHPGSQCLTCHLERPQASAPGIAQAVPKEPARHPDTRPDVSWSPSDIL